jgi:arylsulfatase A
LNHALFKEIIAMKSFSLVLFFIALSANCFAADSRPNIVLIFADDLGYGELGCYGQEKIKTPELDQMAREGLRFTHFYTACPVCAPSRCALMTGKHLGHCHVRDNRQVPVNGFQGQEPIPADTVTIAKLLQQHGYATAAFGKWGLGAPTSSGDINKQGFDLFRGYHCQAHAHSHYPKFIFKNSDKEELPGNDGKTGTQLTHDIFEQSALEFIETNKARPFFLYLPVTYTHVALQVGDEDLAEYRGKLGDDPPYNGKAYLPHPTPRAAYAAMVTRLDKTVGRVRAKLRELNLDKNTLVIFTSDNGPTHNVGGADSDFFNSAAGLRGLKGSVYEGGIREPFIAAWPSQIPAGKVTDQRGIMYDIFPTFCEVAHIKPPAGLDGVSLWPTLTGQGTQPRHPFLYWEFAGYGGQQAVQQGPWKAVRQKMQQGNKTTELYNLENDPNEEKNVAAENPQVVADLEAIMAKEHTPSDLFPIFALDGKKPIPGKALPKQE